MRELAAVKTVVNKSRFFAHLYEVQGEEDLKDILKQHRKSYRKANHHCYAVLIGEDEGFKNDGEVGHPGQVLLELLKKHELRGHALVVSRVFGGVKLGVGGVSRAFRNAGEGVIEHYSRK